MLSFEDAHPIYMCVSPADHLHSCMTTLLNKSTREAEEARLPFLTGEAIATHHHLDFGISGVTRRKRLVLREP